jgi:hypothetical protein
MKKQIKFTMHKNQLSGLIILFLAGLIMFGLGQTLSAQIIRTKPTPQVSPTPPPQRKPLVIRGTGTVVPPREFEQIRRLTPPTPLTQTEKINLFSNALRLNGVAQGVTGLIPFAFLDARTPYAKDRAALIFLNPKGVSAFSNYALFSTQKDDSGVWIYIRATKKNQWFMVDCSADVGNNKRTFKVVDPDPNTFTEVTVSGKAHLQAFLVLDPGYWSWVGFKTPPGPAWEFNYCEVTEGN